MLPLAPRAVNLRAGPHCTARPGPAEILGPVMPNFISISNFKRFFTENLNFIINSFQIKHCSLKNGGILAKSSRNIGKKRPGPTHRNFWPERLGPAQLNYWTVNWAKSFLSNASSTYFSKVVGKITLFSFLFLSSSPKHRNFFSKMSVEDFWKICDFHPCVWTCLGFFCKQCRIWLTQKQFS